MSSIDKLLAHMQSGRPLTAMSARQTYNVVDIQCAIYTIRTRGYHVQQEEIMTMNKYTGTPQTTTEYRMEKL